MRGLLSVTGVHNYRPEHLSRAVAFLAGHHHRFPFAELVAERVGLARIQDAIEDAIAAAGRSPALRQAVDPRR